MKKDKNSEKNMKIVCMILLSIFLVITGIFIACKCAFSGKDTESDVSSDTVIETKDTGFELNIQELEKMAQDPEKGKNLIIPGENDRRVIPDKYNTGCQGDLVKIKGETEINGITVTYSSGNFVFDFFYRNKNISGTVIIENYDFSEHSVVVYNEKSVKGKNIKLVFKNCNFYGFNNGRPESDVFSYEFDNCSFKIFQGSNAVFNKCRFGGSYNDGLIPFSNVTVKDCYFSDFASASPKGNGQHTDGTQMFGYSDSMVKNVLFSNCRFETPQVKMTSSTAYVNACIMLSLEFNNGNNIKIENCILNGGGYSIYAQKKKELTLTDVSFNNIKIGDAKIYGSIYPHCDDNVVFTNVGDQKYLYVSSVWNEDSKTHIIVSNDTAEERTLRVVTGSSSKDFTIGACPGGDKLKNDNYDKPFEDFPFDIDISIDKTDDYVICFDVTDGYEDRIRYVSFDGNPTYYAAKINETPVGLQESDNKVMDPIEGSCGKDITYYLDSSGILKIAGTGIMYDYNSNHPAPWLEYSDKVVSIEISDGITQLGTQVFKNLSNVKDVKLPQSLIHIRANAFIGCSGLRNVYMYSGVTSIDEYAFHGAWLNKCTYYGTEDEWNAIIIGDHNDPLMTCEKEFI